MSRDEGYKSILTITGTTTTPLYGPKSSELGANRGAGQAPVKEQAVPDQLLQIIEGFKAFVKEEKKLSIEVSRASYKPICKIANDIDTVKEEIHKLERTVNKNKVMNEKLKDDTIKALSDVEIAQKAMDHPGGFPCDNSIVVDYFMQLASKFQAQVVALRVELENTEKSIMCELNPGYFTPQELSTTMQRLYECFVALAGRFQFVHAQISNLKAQHLELRRKKLEDHTDIFSKKGPLISSILGIDKSSQLSPSPFSGFGNYPSLRLMASRVKQNDLNTITTPGTPTAFASTPQTLNMLKSPFQASSPLLPTTPTSTPSTKRGKR